jgi:diadenosine tetraphosphate (Ap4A) HIT family hydrolase
VVTGEKVNNSTIKNRYKQNNYPHFPIISYKELTNLTNTKQKHREWCLKIRKSVVKNELVIEEEDGFLYI